MEIRVLVVDDAAFMRDTMKKALRSGFPGFKQDEAYNGRQAMQMLQKVRYDLVLCDWEMPEMSGAELLQWLRGSEAHKDIPFVMITSRGDRENVMQAVQLKVSNYIVKPFTNEKLATVVSSVMTKALGVSLEELKRLAGATGSSHGNDMVAILTAGNAPLAAEPARPAKAPTVVRPAGKVLAPLRFSKETVNCLIRELSQERAIAVVRRADSIPGILDLAVLDIEVDGEVARLNGYVHTLQARDNSQESEFINITINLIDQDDAQKMALLQRYMQHLATV